MSDAVPLKDYADARLADMRWLGAAIAVGFLVVMLVSDAGRTKATEIALEGQHEATKVALDAANDKGAAHNGLLERMRELSATYVTKTTVFLVLGAVLGWGTLAWTVLSPVLLRR